MTQVPQVAQLALKFSGLNIVNLIDDSDLFKFFFPHFLDPINCLYLAHYKQIIHEIT